MKQKVFLAIAVFFAVSTFNLNVYAQVDKIVGLWKTIDDEKNEEKSYVRIYKSTDGLYYGKVEKLLKEPQDKKCEKCPGHLKNQPIVGMIILKQMEQDGNDLDEGKILDPGNGKWYYCYMELDGSNKDKLVVRGSLDSWGVAGRTQYWYRVK